MIDRIKQLLCRHRDAELVWALPMVAWFQSNLDRGQQYDQISVRRASLARCAACGHTMWNRHDHLLDEDTWQAMTHLRLLTYFATARMNEIEINLNPSSEWYDIWLQAAQLTHDTDRVYIHH